MAKIIFVEPNGVTTEQALNIESRLLDVTAATQATNCQITTSTPHGLSVGEHVFFRDIGGMTQLNSAQEGWEAGTIKRVHSVIDSTNFTLDINSTGFSTYTSGGRCRCLGVKRVNQGEITIPAHTLVTGQRFYVTGVAGATQVNNIWFKVGTTFTNGFRVLDDNTNDEVNWATVGGYTGSGVTTLVDGKIIEGATNANPCVITATAHGYTNGQYVYINNVNGMTEINEKVWKVANASTNNFELTGCDSTGFGTFSFGQGYVHRTYKRGEIFLGSSLINQDEVRVTKTGAHTNYAGGRSITWTYNSAVVTYTGSTLVGSIAIGDYICRKGRGGNGDLDGVYEVTGITANSITLRGRYCGVQGTGTDDTIRKITRETGMSPGSGIIFNINGITLSGGWDFDTNLQDGETWLDYNASSGVAANTCLLLSTGGVSEKVNFTRGYYVANFNSGYIKDSTVVGAFVHTINVTTATGVFSLKNTFIGCPATGTSSYNAINITSGKTIYEFENSRTHSWNSTAASAISLSATTTIDFAGLEVHCSGRSVEIHTDNYIKNLVSKNCFSIALIINSRQNVVIEGGDIDGATSEGIRVGTLSSGVIIKGVTVRNCTTGIAITQAQRTIVQDIVFTNNSTNVSLDQYSGSAYLINNQHGAPANWGVLRSTANVGEINIMSDIIDSGSESKAYNITINNENILPQYNLQNAFGQTGRIYGKGSITFDKTVLSPGGNYTTRIAPTANLTELNNFGTFVVDSAYVNQSQAVTLPFFLRASGVWSGTITPILKLNGRPIVTGTPITTMSNGSWDTLSISATSGQVTEDGVLELHLYVVSNTVSFNAVVEGGIFT